MSTSTRTLVPGTEQLQLEESHCSTSDLPDFIDPRPSCEVWKEKAKKTIDLLGDLLPHFSESSSAVTLVPSPVDRWRQRCRFAVRVDGSQVRFLMQLRKKDSEGAYGDPCYCDDFPIASEAVSAAMSTLKTCLSLPGASALRVGLCTVGLHGTKTGAAPLGDLACSLFYNEQMEEPIWKAAAQLLLTETGFSGFVGRAKGQRFVIGRDHVIETLSLKNGRKLRYKQIEGHFSNPNSHIAEATLDWLCEESRSITAHEPPNTVDLLEMFCGNGNHTMALAHDCGYRKILGVEINSILVAAAQENIAMNQVGNMCSIIRAPSSKFVTKMLKKPKVQQQQQRKAADDRKREQRRQKRLAREQSNEHSSSNTDDTQLTSDVLSTPPSSTTSTTLPTTVPPPTTATTTTTSTPPLTTTTTTTPATGVDTPSTHTHSVGGDDYNFKVVLVDPPRAGLDDATRNHLRRYKHILYISCGPEALRRDLQGLSQTHTVARAALFDHFPRTPHLETAVHLSARDTWVSPE
eukprot:m.147871 g.147871  ORF g.147871 m.147871 type:complete len:519 (-) comp30566_c0_seq1:23-1579(-)